MADVDAFIEKLSADAQEAQPADAEQPAPEPQAEAQPAQEPAPEEQPQEAQPQAQEPPQPAQAEEKAEPREDLAAELARMREELERLRAERERAQQPEAQPAQEESAEAAEDAIARARDEAAKQLSEQVFSTLRAEAGEDFDYLPEGVQRAIARAVADAQVNVAEMITRAMQEHLPQLVASLLQQHDAERSFEARFFERWPQLRDHVAEVQQAVAALRSVNPNMSEQDLIERAGAAVVAALGLPLQPQSSQQQQSQPAPAVTQAPAKPGATASSPPQQLSPVEKIFTDWISEYS